MASIFGTFLWDVSQRNCLTPGIKSQHSYPPDALQRLVIIVFANDIWNAMVASALKTTFADVLPLFTTLVRSSSWLYALRPRMSRQSQSCGRCR
jgi:hypothetical protein